MAKRASIADYRRRLKALLTLIDSLAEELIREQPIYEKKAILTPRGHLFVAESSVYNRLRFDPSAKGRQGSLWDVIQLARQFRCTILASSAPEPIVLWRRGPGGVLVKEDVRAGCNACCIGEVSVGDVDLGVPAGGSKEEGAAAF